MLKNCLNCGKEIEVIPARYERTKYCSKACCHVHKTIYKVEKRLCKTCKRQITSPIGGKQEIKYCSVVCRNEGRRKASQSKGNREKRRCKSCDKTFYTFPSRKAKYCSKACANKGRAQNRKGKRFARYKEIICEYCKKNIQKREKYIRDYEHIFCSKDCFHSWDKEYKKSPKWIEKIRTSESSIEFTIANKLEEWGSIYKKQHPIKHYKVDFFIDGHIVLEVNGCYWHYCEMCNNKPPSASQIKRKKRDKALETYCNNHHLEIIFIWEHEIKAKDFSKIEFLRERGNQNSITNH